MKKLSLFAILSILIGSGCSLIQSEDLPGSNKFRNLATYKASDFHLSGGYTYWEVRVHNKRMYADTTVNATKTIFCMIELLIGDYEQGSRKRLTIRPQKRDLALHGVAWYHDTCLFTI